MNKKLLVVGVIIIAVVLGLILIAKSRSETNQESNNQTSTEQIEQKSTQDSSVATENELLQTKIKEVITNYPGYVVGVSVNKLKDNTVAVVNGSQEFIAASTTKVITATYTFNQAQKGNIDIDSTLYPKSDKPADYQAVSFRENIRKMIVNSDNEAWLDLMTYFDKSNIDAYTKELGYDSFTTYGNIISPNDMASFLKELKTEKLVNKTYTNELLGYMEQSWTGPLDINTSYQDIPKKTGWLEDRMHFVGVLPDSNVTFSIYSETTSDGAYDYDEGTAMINDILGVIAANAI